MGYGLDAAAAFDRLPGPHRPMNTVHAVRLPDTEIHPLRSTQVDDDFELWIGRPQAGFAPVPPGPVRVLYLLDANLWFGTAVEMTRLMHKLFGELPPLLVVGIAYPTADAMHQGLLRTRDFTPSVDAAMAARAGAFPTPPHVPVVEPAMGGAAPFLRFLVDEVQPFVEERYEPDPAGRILYGSSLGGLFAAWTFTGEPSAFDHYIAVSPALWWNGDEIFDRIATRPRLTGDRHVDLFIGVGGLEETPAIPSLAPFRMVSNARRFAERLEEDRDEGLRLHFEEISGETHTSVVPVGLTRGLRTMLGSARSAARPGE